MPAAATLIDPLGALEDGGDRPAIRAFRQDGTVETISFRDLAQQARRVAGGLRASGLEPGEFVGIYAPNSPAWIAARVGLLLAGGVAVSLDSDLSIEQLRQQLADSGARRIFTAGDHLDTLKEAGGGELETWLLDAGEDDPRSLARLLDEPLAESPKVAADEVATLFYTSGTTGQPKGVPLTHRNIVGNIEAILAHNLVKAADSVLLPLPLHHSYPFIVGMLIPLIVGATIVLPAGVSGPEIRRALAEGDVAVVVGVPRLYDALASGLTQRLRTGGGVEKAMYWLLRLSGLLRRRFGVRWGRTLLKPLHKRVAPKLRLLASGGAKLEAETSWTLEAFGWMVLSGYGLVETASISTFNPPGRARLGSAGLPAPGVELRIAEPNAQGHGEVQIKGPNVFQGYRHNPEANAEAFTEDGWFRSGDLGWRDEEGYLWLAGRVKEMIVLPDGKNIAPEEVEAVYAESPYIREIAVLEHGGQLVGLVVPDLEALRGAGGRIEDLIRIALAENGPRLPAYKRLGDWAITRERLPRTHLGKFQRHKLPPIYERAERGQGPGEAVWSDADNELLREPRVRRVFDWLQAKFPDRKLSPDTSPQLDLGIDSLAWVQLGLEIEEQFAVALSEEAIGRTLTVRDLLREVEAAPAAEAGADKQRALIAEAERWLRPRGALLSAGAATLHVLLKMLCKLLFRLRVEGGEALPGRGPIIIAPNHVSDIDPFVLAAALPGRVRGELTWGADRDRLFGNPAGRLLARLGHLFPVDDRAPAASLAVAAEVLSRGRILIWFPEEWRSPDGGLQRFLPGIGRILNQTHARVVPCYIAGAFEAMPRQARLPRPHPVTVHFGPAVTYDELKAAAGSDDDKALAAALRDRVALLQSREER
ncbi:AMP-binding protein [Ferruginivarius sediminum]|uniref:Carrier domain-containing protein n=1 Tax=Ferruginivarius sediminum TaxID=2661937 RepID=A0A369T888_9PROT|nr:AMP-binding protein [Ferruginivarius sediminum]RDD60565.1 hypothetical protein DRB17_17390 [Ferruginivarius sediminum]